jgi:ADP-ribose pyrophosphatase YjhB (NUDIX family)
MSFTIEETKEFCQLLRKIAKNGYYFPTEKCMRVAHSIVSMWASELVILRVKKNIKEQSSKFITDEILLTVYDGGIKEFQGKWHIPGGYNRWQEPDIQTTCSRIALREIGVDVRYLCVIDAYKWKKNEHPYGRPLSLYVLCEPKNPIQENDKCRFFSKRHLPQNLLNPHQRFIAKFLR